MRVAESEREGTTREEGQDNRSEVLLISEPRLSQRAVLYMKLKYLII